MTMPKDNIIQVMNTPHLQLTPIQGITIEQVIGELSADDRARLVELARNTPPEELAKTLEPVPAFAKIARFLSSRENREELYKVLGLVARFALAGSAVVKAGVDVAQYLESHHPAAIERPAPAPQPTAQSPAPSKPQPPTEEM
jgi:hypothetical protein